MLTQKLRVYFKQLWCSQVVRLVLATAAAHSNSISVGLTQGYSAVLLPQLIGDHSLNVTQEEASWVAALGVISTPVGALLSGVLVEVIGRKTSVIATNVPFLIGWITIGVADDIRFLYIGRIISALAVGMTTSSYLYVAESSTKEHRGVLSAFGPIFVSLGVLIVYTLGFFLPWKLVALVASSFSIFSALSMLQMPETPEWYISHNETQKALDSLKWLRQNKTEAETELSVLLKTKSENENFPGCKEANLKNAFWKGYLKSLVSPTVYKPLCILILFFIFQEGSGIYIFLFYAIQIFEEFGTDYNESLVSVTVGVLRLIMAIFGAYLMSKFGRRQLAVFSGVCMSASMLVICLFEQNSDLFAHSFGNIVPIVCVLSHVGFSMTGFLQLPWILTSELFPVSYRGILSGFVSSLAYILIFITIKIYPTLLKLLQLTGVLWIFFAMSGLGAVFLYFYLPETKDKTLEEISKSFLNQTGKSSANNDLQYLTVVRNRDQKKGVTPQKDVSLAKDEVPDFRIVCPHGFFHKLDKYCT